MRTINLVAVGLLSMLMATAAIVSPSFAAQPERVDVISTLNEKTAQADSAKLAAAEAMRVDVKGATVEVNGPSYPYLKPINR